MASLTDPPPARADATPRRAVARTSRSRLLVDRAARSVVTAGGLGIIASVLGILVFILIEVVPLLGGADVTPVESIPLPSDAAEAVLVDEHRTHVAALGLDGVIRIFRKSDGGLASEAPLFPPGPDGVSPRLAAVVAATGTPVLAGSTDDGRVAAVRIGWDVAFDTNTGAREVTPDVGAPIVFHVDPEGRPLGAFAAILGESGSASVLAQTASGDLAFVRLEVRENAITGERSSVESRTSATASGRRLVRIVASNDLRDVYAGSETGELLHWKASDGSPGDPEIFPATSGPVAALALLLGDRSVIVGGADGSVSVWFQTRGGDDVFRMRRIRDFAPHGAPIVRITPSPRDKGFAVADAEGGLGLYYSTSARTLWRGSTPHTPVRALLFAPKADALYAASDRVVGVYDVENPHPEVGWKALFGKVWYESYPEPAHVWQSTGGTDDFESKLSLTPLVFGTLKATVYSLLLAIPLGVFGAMYTSQFMHPSLKRYVKPTVEIMAALPSVVLGFLGGLWLAPIVEKHFPALLLAVPFTTIAVLAAGLAWSRLPRPWRNRIPTGAEVGVYALALASGAWLAAELAPAFASVAFGGNFQVWLLETTGLRYDQRNAVVVGLAMGFAVIPIIFAIAEDAFSNVPLNLVSGSLALGANRWQTVTRVVLPTASPGIFSAIMVGFGRAVGETMIVLMATGNTPIMDWSAFNGFRTLSANIAVEIPEAPVGSTLYRTLFLAGLLLFLVTFAVNTVAEIVRQRLRRRYSQL
ncbi:MAG TPA: ABC transporter permease subunit [Candidatus Polarisedimenticolaceae bacterium]